MKFKFYIYIFCFLILSCENINTRKINNVKEIKKRELTFKNINSAWGFEYPTSLNPNETINAWTQWKVFLDELTQKPSPSVSAYRYKIKNISKKVDDLNINIPINFDVNPVKIRVSTLTTEIKMIELYFNLNRIPEKDVLKLISQINVDINSLQYQLDKIIEKNKIPLEEGEMELLQKINNKATAANGSALNQNK